MAGVSDPVLREQITVKYWDSLKHAVDAVYRSGGIDVDRKNHRWEECFSEACLGWVQGLNSYEEGVGATLSTYCITCAKNQVRSWVRRTNRWGSNEYSWETSFIDVSLQEEGDGSSPNVSPEIVYGGVEWNKASYGRKTMVLPMYYLWGELDPQLNSPERDYIFQERLYQAKKHYTPIYKAADKINRAILNKIILAVRPESQERLAKYYEITQQAIQLRYKKLITKLRLED